MLTSSRQHLADVQIADIDRVILGALTLINTTTQNLKIRVRVRCEEERQRIPFVPGSVPDAMYRGLELAVGLPLEVLADVADERAGLGRRIDPDAVLIEDLEGGDRILEDKCQV